ncbi:hypothetical protein ACFXOM_09985 [Streptomyces sp. NPDC059169]|uniref:hypothetical protein n=1 Tax=Streptomyces sp. NPDC059169 TaxID=3346754 RepID=UPI0036A74949
MGDHVPVRCPVCRRAHTFASPVYPCACGAPLAPPLLRGAPPVPIRHRNWTDEWVGVRCQACGREGEWPQPELGCPCGTVLRIPVRPVTAAPTSSAGAAAAPRSATAASGSAVPGAVGPGGAGTGPGGAGLGAPGFGTPAPDTADPLAQPARPAAADADPAEPCCHPSGCPSHLPVPAAASGPRPAFRPVAIRTARDVVTAAAHYLRWLGFQDVVQPEEQPESGIDLWAPGLVAQVDPSTSPATVRAVECLWLNGLSASATSVFFALAGYEDEARRRADELVVPLFVMDLTGTPQPVNGPAEELLETGAPPATAP